MRHVHQITVPLGPELMNEPTLGFIFDTSVLRNTQLSPHHGNKYFRLKTHLHLPPLTKWAVYGSWYDPGNQNEDHYFIKYWTCDHWHQSQWYKFKTDLISMPHNDHDQLIALVIITFDQKAHSPDLELHPYHDSLALNSTSTGGCWPCWVNCLWTLWLLSSLTWH